MTERTASCSTCRYWNRDGSEARFALRECLRRAPVAYVPSPTAPQGAYQVTWPTPVWPIVRGEQWCGEYEQAADTR